jgi:hypothetical protein
LLPANGDLIMRQTLTQVLPKLSLAVLVVAATASAAFAQAKTKEEVTTIYEEIYAKCTTSKAAVVQAPPPAPAPAAPQVQAPPPAPVPALW